jgi:hypothetical protein
MDELKEKKLNILKGKIKEINDIESKEQELIPMKKGTKSKKAITSQTDHEEQIALRRKK